MFEKLKDMICQYVEIDPEEIEEDSRFSEDLGFNSYDFISMLGDAEDAFAIEIEEAIAVKKKTVGELLAYFEEMAT